MSDKIRERIRGAVVERRYTVSEHAYDEIDEDHLDVLDIESALLSGEITRVFTLDPRGTRYEIVGMACDLSTRVGVVLRFVREDRLLIVTAYEIESP